MGRTWWMTWSGPCAAAGLLLVGSPAARLAADDAMPLGLARALVRAPEFDRAIATLEADDLREELELRRETLAAFVTRVRAGGDELVQAAIEVVLHGEPADRRQAELLLAQHPRLPGRACRRLEGADSFEPWALAQLLRRENKDYLLDLLRADPQESGGYGGAALTQVEAELARRVARTDGELARCNEEYVDDYRRFALPILDRLGANIKWDECVLADLDGDGDAEVVVACNPWRRTDRGWKDSLSFLALIDRFDAASPWYVAGFERFEEGEEPEDLLVRDFDHDGRPEVAIRSRAWNFGAVRMVAAGTSAPFPRLFTGKSNRHVLLLERSAEEPVRFVTSASHVLSLAGTSQERVGTLAFRRACFTWSRGAFVPAETLFVPL